MNDSRAMSILEHLGEFKRRMIRVGIVFLVMTIAAFVLHEPIFDVLKGPAEDALEGKSGEIVLIQVTEGLAVTTKIAVIVGFALTVPYLLFELSMFLRPGLSSRERKYLYLMAPGGTISFAAGVAFGFFILLPPAIDFLLDFGAGIATPLIALGLYVNLMVALLFWMGLIFEMPIVMFLLAKLGVLNARWLAKQRRWAILGAFVLGAVITPTFDPATQSMVAGPIIVLFELGLQLAKFAQRGRHEEVAESGGPA